MGNPEDKNKQKELKAQIKALEVAMKSAFKEGHFDAMKESAAKLKTLDPENRLAKKLLEKVDGAKKKQDALNKKVKTKEYESMLKKLYKDGELEKLKALAKELKEFNPENKAADKWREKAEKLEAKAKGVDFKKKGKDENVFNLAKDSAKEAPKEAPKVGAPIAGSSFFGNLFAKSAAKAGEAVKKDTKPEEKPVESGDKPKSIFAKAVAHEAPKAPAPLTPKPMAAAPVTPAAPVAPKPMAAAPVAPKPAVPVAPATSPTPPTPPVAPKAPDAKGNLFTKMFKKGEEEKQTQKSIIDTIVAKTDEKKQGDKPVEKKSTKLTKVEEKDASGLLTFSKVFLNFTAIFIVFSAAFLYVDFLDEENTMLSLVGVEHNTGSRLKAAADENTLNKRQEAILTSDIELYKGGYQDKALETVNQIIDERINWPDIFAKINEVTDSVYELNQGDHHDHLVCIKCRRVEEFVDPMIEQRQEVIAEEHGFKMTDHCLYIYGVCKACSG